MTSIEILAIATPIVFTLTTALTGWYLYYQIMRDYAAEHPGATANGQRSRVTKPTHTMAE